MDDEAVFKIIEAMMLGVHPSLAERLEEEGKLEDKIREQGLFQMGLKRQSFTPEQIAIRIPDYTAMHLEPKDNYVDMISRVVQNRTLQFNEQLLAYRYILNDFRRSLDFVEEYIDKARDSILKPREHNQYMADIARLLSRAKKDLDIVQKVLPEDSEYAEAHQADYTPMKDRLFKIWQRYYRLAEEEEDEDLLSEILGNRIIDLALLKTELTNAVMVGDFEGANRLKRQIYAIAPEMPTAEDRDDN